MSIYIGEKGGKVQTVASDPSNPIEGEIWYNSTSYELKFYDGSTTKTVTTS